MKMMKALQVTLPRTFELVQVSVPKLKELPSGRVLVRPEWVSLCGSDIPFFTGKKRNRAYPLLPGAPIHECVGRVLESTASQFQPGELVLAIPEADQGLAECFVSLATKTVALPEGLDDPGAACLVQPLSTVLNAVDRLGSVEGKSFAIVGLGSIGLFFTWVLKQCGAGAITGIDPLPERCKRAEALGADRVIACRSNEVVHTARQPGLDWLPPQVCVEAVGHQMDTLNDCLELAAKRGTVLAFGVPDHPQYSIEYEIFFRKNLHLLGVVTPDWSEYLPKALEIYLANKKTLSGLVTHRLPIQDAARTFTMYECHQDGMIKALLDTSNW